MLNIDYFHIHYMFHILNHILQKRKEKEKEKEDYEKRKKKKEKEEKKGYVDKI